MKLPIHISKDSREPIYHQIEKQLKALIAGDHLMAQAPLPSIRVLAKELEISVITIRRAYQNLENNGFIETIQGKGTFVATIDEELKNHVKVSTVKQVFEKAIDTATSFDYTSKDIELIFREVLSNYKEEKGS